jgi:hypothetical protein
MTRRATIAIGLAAVLVIAGAEVAAAFDVTGTWTGTTKCTSLFAGTKFKFTDAPTVQVTQSGDLLGVRIDFGGGNVNFYAGRAYPDAKKPDAKGEVALVACGTDSVAGNAPAFDELARLAAATKDGKVKATLKGVSFFSDPGTASPEAGSCKWKLTRVDEVDAAIPTSCPTPF